jgi:trans-aconitate methyltransferase
MPQKGAAAHEQDPSYYDRIYRKIGRYKLPWNRSNLAPVWRRLADALVAADVTSVLELGCGTGQLASCLKERIPKLEYTGLDFSPVAIWIAEGLYPHLRFELKDFNDDDVFDAAVDAVVLTEVLEHLDDDRALLRRIPKGTLVAFSVPNFDDQGHTRYFDTEKDVIDWYAKSFQTLDVSWVHYPTSRMGFWLGIGRT